MNDLPQVQEVRALVQATDRSLDRFQYARGSSLGCITDVAFTVETWRDARGVVRKLSFENQGMMGTGGITRVLYRDDRGRPRSLLQSETDGFDFSKPTAGQHPASGTTGLFVNASGLVVGRVMTGHLKRRTPIRWPQVLAELNPDELMKRYTCKR